MTWERVGGQLPRSASVQGNFLKFNRIDIDDAGTYRCVASNAAGNAIAMVTIRVEGKTLLRQ